MFRHPEFAARRWHPHLPPRNTCNATINKEMYFLVSKKGHALTAVVSSIASWLVSRLTAAP